MADQNSPDETSRIRVPEVTRKKRRVSWIWLVPVVAALAGGSLVLRTWLEAGPSITISFKTAEGLEVGKTQLRYKDVNVGLVKTIKLSEDRSRVIVTADIDKDAASLAREGSSFWVVRPRLGLSGVSGLSTLVSGAYIGVDAPAQTSADGKRVTTADKTEFVGLETPPEVTHDRPGKRFSLKADNLGSLDVGSPVYYRRISVGQVIGYQLDSSGKSVNIQVFIDAPNDKFVTTSTHFWNASGVDFTVNADGLKVRTQSLLSVAVGGIAFEDMDDSTSGAAPGASTAPQGLPPSALAGKGGPADGQPMSPEQSASAALRTAAAAAQTRNAAASKDGAGGQGGQGNAGNQGTQRSQNNQAGQRPQGTQIQPEDNAGKQAGNAAPGQAGAGAPKSAQAIQAPGSSATPSAPSPAVQGSSRVAKADSIFTLYGSESAAKATPDGDPFLVRMRFDQSIRGLTVGANIDFNGIVLGQVDAINMDFDTKKKRFFAVIDANLYPQRLGPVFERVRDFAITEEGAVVVHPGGRLLGSMIEHGLRAQLRTANLLTGQLYVALDVFPNLPPVDFKWDGVGRADIPTTQGNLDQLQQQITNIVNKIEKIPFDKIGNDLSTTLTAASRLMNKLDKQVAPEAQAMIKQASKSLNDISTMLSSDNGVLANSDRAIQELTRAARSLRVLSEFLQVNPEALLRGRGDDPIPGRSPNRK
ncbi:MULTISPECIES: intermembrane transport protein PqiB [unclassified Achromobacter]|uniref:PqiB family protein n=1 Tax=unclassified Achromobacter TaxID=2626865 RepID=UPI001E2BF7E6|nr:MULTISPECIES: MlaD family protein [unclassified Achromobacter]